jgi:putative glycosyltransferase (TIGR04348 family)
MLAMVSTVSLPPSVCIVTPALADANNGNWQTARRWARMLRPVYRVRLARQWPDGVVADADDTDLLLALHARRSAASIVAWAEHHPDRPLVLALTGTDLYRDIAQDASAQRSLALAHRLIVLQDQAPLALPAAHRTKAHVVYQSCTPRVALPRTDRHLRVVVVGHLRPEKSPQTVFEIARQLSPDEGIRIDHLGHALDAELGAQAQATAAACPHYRWLGGVSHEAARRRIQRAHLLLHPSQMEGGAHVVMEAVTCGTPVLASKVPGNVGMLGQDYAGYFPADDAPTACAWLRRCRTEQQRLGLAAAGTGWSHLRAQCALRAPLFAPAAETQALRRVLCAALSDSPTPV